MSSSSISRSSSSDSGAASAIVTSPSLSTAASAASSPFSVPSPSSPPSARCAALVRRVEGPAEEDAGHSAGVADPSASPSSPSSLSPSSSSSSGSANSVSLLVDRVPRRPRDPRPPRLPGPVAGRPRMRRSSCGLVSLSPGRVGLARIAEICASSSGVALGAISTEAQLENTLRGAGSPGEGTLTSHIAQSTGELDVHQVLHRRDRQADARVAAAGSALLRLRCGRC